MKKLSVIFFVFIILLLLCGCASREAREFDKQVEAVLSLPSVSDKDIAFLINTYDALSPKDKTQVKNYVQYQRIIGDYLATRETSPAVQSSNSNQSASVQRIDEEIYNENGIIITILSVKQNANNDYTIKIEVKNNTAEELHGGHIIADLAWINDTNIRVRWSGPSSIPSNKTVTFDHDLVPEEFTEAGINSDIMKFEFQIKLWDKNMKELETVTGSIDGKYFN